VVKTKRIVEKKTSGTLSMMTRFSPDQQIREAAEDRKKEVASKGADSTQSHQQPLITTPAMVDLNIAKIDIRVLLQEALTDARREEATEAAEEECRHRITEEVALPTKDITHREDSIHRNTTTSTSTVLTTTWGHHLGTMSTLHSERDMDHLQEEAVLHARQEADLIQET